MRILVILLICSALSFAHELGAQNCGCADQGNCEFNFGANSSTQVCYDITDAFNNNLADPNQGVCGVYIKFRHGLIGALDMTLTSPNGTQVQLVGATGSCNCSTPVAIWDILFVANPTQCEPDTTTNCPMPCVFNGCPNTCIPACWPNGYFTGSYLPFSGSLNDFNSGPVNGQWCIEIDNGAQFNGGKIFDFEVLLCDQSGILCCDADAGAINTPDFSACQGDSSLILSPSPGYGALEPDPAEYGYTFAIFNNSLLTAYETMPDLRTYPAGSYQVCGLSYRYADTLDMPATGTVWTPLALYDTLTGPNPPFCGDIRTNCIDITIYAPPPPVNLIDTVCVGETVSVGDSTFTSTGLYLVLLESFGGCDSLVNLNLTVLQVDSTDLQATLCPGESFSIANSSFSTTGIHTVILQNKFGCDSVITLHLTILEPADTMIAEMICSGDTVWVGSNAYTATGVYVDTLTSFFNCDSIVTLDLSVVEVSVFIPVPDTLTCLQTAVPLQASAVTNFGTLSYLWSTNAATQSISVSLPGAYSVTASAAGCSAADTTAVFQNATDPVAVIVHSPANILTCSLTSIQLNGSGSSSANGPVEYSWTAQGGSPVSNPNLPAIQVTVPDTYVLNVTDPVNGCTDMTSIVIFQNITPPVAEAGPNAVLSCQAPTLTLNGSGSTPAGILSFQWSTVNGHFIPPANTANPAIDIDEAGMYFLTVTNLVNDCMHTDSVLIEPDTVGPHILMALPQGSTLTCALEELTLDASASVTNPNVSVQWTGDVNPTPNPLIVMVTEPGVFTLTMTDIVNGCSDSESVTIGIDTILPAADAGPDHTITCTSISTFTLGGPGTSTGPEFSYEWTSSPGGNFTFVTDSSFTKANTAAMYYLMVTNLNNGCMAVDSAEIIDEANFPPANAGPDLELTCKDTTVTLIAETDPVITNYTWTDLGGNVIASGSSSTMINVNAPGIFILTIDNVLCESADTVQVTENALLPMTDAGLDLLLDCLTGQATLDGSNSATGPEYTYQWTTPTGHFVSGENTLTPVVDEPGVYSLQVINTQTECIGFDTAIVLLDTVACMPLANAGADGVLNCYNQFSGDTLQASGSTGPNISYQWIALSGSIQNAANPFAPVVTAGIYVFSVTNTAVNLTATDTVNVLQDVTPPVANAGPSTQFLDCPSLAGCYPLDVSNTSQGAGFVYQWVAPGPTGSLCTPPDVLNAEINGQGFYELTVTNLNNGCTAITTVLIQLNGSAPVANAGPNIQMNCGETEALLNGNGSTTGPNLSYEWFSLGGNILSNANTLTPAVSPNNTTDTFHLVVVNNVNLCRDTDEVVVFSPLNCFPVCAATVSGQLDCSTSTVLLSGNGSSVGADITYQWSTVTGVLCGGETTLSACASAPGIYRLTVTRTYPNGATFSSECDVQVFQNIQPPIANAGPDRNLTCKDTVLILDGSASSTGPNFTYLWTTTGGNILNGETTLAPTVDATGQYNLLVTDTSNGCTTTDFMLVGLDTLHPVAEAGPGDQLTCSDNTTVLNGSATPANVTYKWTSSNPNNGGIIAGSTTPTPIIGSAGTYYLTVTIPTNGCSGVDSTIVTEDGSIPDINAGPVFYYTCADTSFTLAATASGGTVLTFQWTANNGGCFSGPSDILQPTVACPGTYQLVATDQVNSCTAISQTEVIDLSAPPIANAGSTQEINCDQFVVTLDGSGSSPAGQLDFQWFTLDGHILSGETTASLQVDSAGLYQLIVIDQQTLCRDTDAVLVTIDASIPVITAGPDTTLTCSRTSLKLDGSGSTTGTGIAYTWTTSDGHIVSGANSLSPLVDLPGTYTLTIEDLTSQCIVQDSTVVTMDTVPPVAAINMAQNLTLNCANSQITLNGGLSMPLGNLNYHWSTQDGHILFGDNAVNATVDSVGTYLLTVTHTRNGCTDTAPVTVNENYKKPLLVFAPAPTLNCDNPEVTIHVLPPGPGADYYYQWSGPQPILNAESRTPTVSNPGVYFLTITDISNGCTNNSSIVVQSNFIEPNAVAQTLVSLGCENEVALVSGKGSSNGNTAYEWSTNDGGNIFSPNDLETEVDAPGWYFLTVTNLDNGCRATDSTEVINSSTPIENAVITLDFPDCTDPEGYILIDSISGGTPPYTFSLNEGDPIPYPKFSFLDPGSYDVLIKDVNGCEWSLNVELPELTDISVELGDDLTIRQGEQVELLAQINFPLSWVDTVFWQNLPDSAQCPQCLSQVVSPKETTTYRIHIFDTNGCMVMDKITVFVEELRPFYVPTAFSPNEDGVNDRFLPYSGKEVVLVHSFRIFDRWGNLVFQAKEFQPNDPAVGWDGRFEGKTMNPAVFVWTAEVEFLDGYREVFYGEVSLVR